MASTCIRSGVCSEIMPHLPVDKDGHTVREKGASFMTYAVTDWAHSLH